MLSLSLLACRESDGQRRSVTPPLREVSSPGQITDARLSEASGLVRSTQHEGVFWSHGDSGNDAQLFAFDSAGVALGAPRVDGAKNRDWEALASGPCARGTCLYIGDVGDNMGRRKTVTIYRIPEPAPTDTITAPVEKVEIAYSDGPQDVEAIWITPDTSVWFLTKRPDRAGARWRAARIYRMSAEAWRSTGTTVAAALVDSIAIVPMRGDEKSWITDATFSPPDSIGAYRLAVRTYGDVYLFEVDPVTWRPTSLAGKCSLDGLREKDSGEGVTWLADGRLLFNHEGAKEPLFAGRCP